VAEPEKPKTQVELNQEKIDSDLTCKICGKICKSKLGLGSHMRSHKEETVNE
jgi:hypothetical protein